MKKIALVHTGFALVEVLTRLFNTRIPDAELIHIVDDSLLREVLAAGEVTRPVTRRMLAYYQAAETYEVDCIFNVCSSVGEVADLARQVVATPVVKIDDSMAEAAVIRAGRIGVAATLQTTLDPTCRLVERKAAEAGRRVSIQRTLCPGAFEKLMAGQAQEHDRIVLEGIRELSEKVEMIVLAQGSMARLAENLEPTLAERVLTSPASGVEAVRKLLASG
jgi:Asp/Glu/hydantoin racemase